MSGQNQPTRVPLPFGESPRDVQARRQAVRCGFCGREPQPVRLMLCFGMGLMLFAVVLLAWAILSAGLV
jgi:hypothetical protein